MVWKDRDNNKIERFYLLEISLFRPSDSVAHKIETDEDVFNEKYQYTLRLEGRETLLCTDSDDLERRIRGLARAARQRKGDIRSYTEPQVIAKLMKEGLGGAEFIERALKQKD